MASCARPAPPAERRGGAPSPRAQPVTPVVTKPVIIKRAVWPSRMPEAMRAAAEKQRHTSRPSSARIAKTGGGGEAETPRRPATAFVSGTTRAVQLREQRRQMELQRAEDEAFALSRPASARPVYGSPRSGAATYGMPPRPASARDSAAVPSVPCIDPTVAPLCFSVAEARKRLEKLSHQIAASPENGELIAQRAVLLRRTGAFLEAVDDYSTVASLKKRQDEQAERQRQYRKKKPGAAVRLFEDVLQSASQSAGAMGLGFGGAQAELLGSEADGAHHVDLGASMGGEMASIETSNCRVGVVSESCDACHSRDADEVGEARPAFGVTETNNPPHAFDERPGEVLLQQAPFQSAIPEPGAREGVDAGVESRVSESTTTLKDSVTSEPYYAGLGSELPGSWGKYVPVFEEDAFVEEEGISINAKRELEDMSRLEERDAIWRALRGSDRRFGGIFAGHDAVTGGGGKASSANEDPPGNNGGQGSPEGMKMSRAQRLREAFLLHAHVRQLEQELADGETRQAMRELPVAPKPIAAAPVNDLNIRRLGRASRGTKTDDFRVAARAAAYNGSYNGASRDIMEVMSTKIGQITLLRAASAEPGERASKDLEILNAVLRGSIPALRAFTDEGLSHLTQAATFHTVDINTLLLCEGDPQRSVYFVLEGLVAMRHARANSNSTAATTTVSTKRQGMHFGSFQLMRPTPTPSPCSALTLERCLLLRFDEAQIVDALVTQERLQCAAGQLLHPLGSLHARMRFLASMRLSHSLSWEQALSLAALLQPRTYARNQPVVRQGEPATGLYIIESGRCVSHRDVEFESEAASRGEDEDAGGGGGGAVTKRVDADTLVARDIFGHESILSHGDQTARHVLTYVPTTAELHLLFLPRHEYVLNKSLFSEHAMRELKLGYRLQASDELLRRRHIMTAEWEVAKGKYVDQVMASANAKASIAMERIGRYTRRSARTHSSQQSPRVPDSPAGAKVPQPLLTPRQQEQLEFSARVRKENAALQERIAQRRRGGRPSRYSIDGQMEDSRRGDMKRHEVIRLAVERNKGEEHLSRAGGSHVSSSPRR